MNIPFFSNLFQKKSIKLSLTELNQKLIEEEKNRFNEFEKKTGSIFSQINYLLKKINELNNLIKEKEISREGRVGKIVSSSKKDFVNQVNSLTSKLIPPSNHSFKEIKIYSINSNKFLETELIKIHKLIALTAFGLKEEMKELGNYLKELNQAFIDLQKNLLNSKLIKLNELKLNLNEFNELEKQLTELNSSIKNNEKQVIDLKKLIQEKEKELNSLKSSNEAKQLIELNNEIIFLEKQKNQLKLNAVNLIGKANKPLKKLIKLIESNRFISKDYSVNDLNLWLFDSLKAMKSDQKGEKIKLAVIDCIKLINDNSLQAKNEKEKNKWIEALNEINSINFFEEFFWKLNSIKSKKNEFEQKINSIELNKKINELNKKINELNQKLIELTALNEKQLNLIKQKKSQLIELKNKIIFLYSDFTNEKIELN